MDAPPPIDVRDALDELGRISLGDNSVASVLDRVAALAKAVVPGADEVSVTLLVRDKPNSPAATGPLALALDESQYDRGHGPCLDSARGAEVLSIKDTSTETRWPHFAASAAGHGVGSTLSVPIPVQPYTAAALNMYALEPDAFTDRSRELATSFAAYAAVVIANMHLHESTRHLAENLRQAMEHRAIIEQAKGVLMGQRRCSASDAFDILVTLSQTSNRKLRFVAQAVVDSADETDGQGATRRTGVEDDVSR